MNPYSHPRTENDTEQTIHRSLRRTFTVRSMPVIYVTIVHRFSTTGDSTNQHTCQQFMFPQSDIDTSKRSHRHDDTSVIFNIYWCTTMIVMNNKQAGSSSSFSLSHHTHSQWYTLCIEITLFPIPPPFRSITLLTVIDSKCSTFWAVVIVMSYGSSVQ